MIPGKTVSAGEPAAEAMSAAAAATAVSVSAVTWTVFRMDDNGNRFAMRTGLDRPAADRVVAEFEARGHKQAYWAEPSRG